MTEAAPGTVVARGLTRRFGEKVAVRPFDVAVGPGGITGLLGPNGSGKTTFLRMLLGLVPRHGGEAAVDGAPLRGDGTEVRRRSTYVPGESALYGELTGARHLAWLLRGRGRDALARATGVAERFGLPLGRRVRGYSHGMKRQLQVAAALGPRARVRVLDEPTEGLDPTHRAGLLELLVEEAEAGTTILLSSHHLGEVDRACRRLLFLAEGRLIADEDAPALAARARRIVTLTFDGDAEPHADRLRALAGGEVRASGPRASVLLSADDPRPFLARLADDSLPAPRTVSYGEPSLRELYRDLYGVEGV